MLSKVVARRSMRDAIMWDFYVVLDRMPEGEPGRVQFVREVLGRFGIPEALMPEIVAKVCAHLPVNLHETSADQMLRVFEEVLPIEWEEDLQLVAPGTAIECERAVLAILAARTSAQLPREVATMVMREIERVLGSPLDPMLLPGATQALEEAFIHDLWRCKDAASQKQLSDRLLLQLKQTARLDFSARRAPS
jgi:hypothetical protein